MSGSRHHVIPKFLLKGFSSKVKGKEIYTWFYRKDKEPFETTIKNISVARNFYGKEGEVSVDCEITYLESRYAQLIDKLRNQDGLQEIFDPKLPEFIAHLCVRTKHLRDSVIMASDDLLDISSELLTNPEKIKIILLNYFKVNPQALLIELDKRLEEASITNVDKTQILEILLQKIPSEIERQKVAIAFLMKQTIQEFKSLIPTTVKEAHINALLMEVVPILRAEEYRNLRWFVYKSDIPLILGDIGCLFEIDGRKRFKSINDTNDKIKNIFLPISTNTVIIGTSLSDLSNIRMEILNECIAKLSREFFVCSDNSINILNLASLLGEKTELIAKEEIEEIVINHKIVKDYFNPEHNLNTYSNQEVINSYSDEAKISLNNDFIFPPILNKDLFYELLMCGKIIDVRRGGLVIGRSLKEGGIYMIMPIEENAFTVVGVMEGNQYILNRKSSVNYRKRLLEINKYIDDVNKSIENLNLSTDCRLFNTYDLVEDKIVLVEQEQFIVNKIATTKYFAELEKLNNLLDNDE